MENVINILSLKSAHLKYKSKSHEAYKSTGLSPMQEGPRSKEETEFQNTPQNVVKTSDIITSGESQYQGSTSIIGGGAAPAAVRKILEENYEIDHNCQLIHEDTTPRIHFKVPDLKATQKSGTPVYSVLQCADISAADLRVSSKFGSWDSMSATIIIECEGPLFAWRRRTNNDPVKDKEMPREEPGSTALYEYTILSACMVKATFAVEDVAKARNILHNVKVAKTREIASVKELKKNGVIAKHTKNPSKIREGLPQWVNYIPYRWYSANVRRALQYLMMLYTLLSLMWALWQLYRHVDLIRVYLQPIVQFLQHYFSILKAWLQWVDNLFSILSIYWWNYCKPLLMIVGAVLSPLFQIFRPLRGIVNVIPFLFDPFVKFFNMLFLFVKPLVLPLKTAVNFASQYIISVITYVLSHAVQNPTVANLIHRGSKWYLVQLVNEALHGHLDPLKAQFIVIRDLMFKSFRKIYYGMRFIVTRAYFMIIFLKREREYTKEGDTAIEHTEQEEREETLDKPKTE